MFVFNRFPELRQWILFYTLCAKLNHKIIQSDSFFCGHLKKMNVENLSIRVYEKIIVIEKRKIEENVEGYGEAWHEKNKLVY